jgi:hypothetical protein
LRGQAVGTVERCLACEAIALERKRNVNVRTGESVPTAHPLSGCETALRLGLRIATRSASQARQRCTASRAQNEKHQPRLDIRRIVHSQIFVHAIVVEVSTRRFSRFRLHSGKR